MTAPSLFPFTTYLCDYLRLPSSHALTIEPLSGGLTNNTVRAVFSEPVSVRGSQSSARYKSLVVKHAPPYIASLGPEHALSTKRQAIEAQALAIFSRSSSENLGFNLADVLHRHPNIRIPQLLHHDEEQCVLVMSDLGREPMLLEYLADGRNGFLDAAATLAKFLADLHQSTKSVPDEFLHLFTNEDSSNVVQNLVGTLPGKILKSAGQPDAEALGKNVEHDMASDEGEQCFGMVDLWPGSVLVGDNFVGLVDWEYAGKSTAGSEIGMLTAHLRIPLLSPLISVDRSSVISDFLSRFLSVYAAHSPTPSKSFVRSALMAHGRELINAVEFQSAELDGDEHKDALIQAGARSLRAASRNNREEREQALSERERSLLSKLI